MNYAVLSSLPPLPPSRPDIFLIILISNTLKLCYSLSDEIPLRCLFMVLLSRTGLQPVASAQCTVNAMCVF